MFLRRMMSLAGLLVLLAAPMPAVAQEDESILVDIVVNYGVAFRNDTWVPIDVLVRNTERDVRGFVEIKTYDFNGDLQSPTYRLPAESPRQSQKRFRLYCKLNRVDRIEAQLYHGNRSALPGPTRLQVTAIDSGDYLGLILDDAHQDYGFLSDNRVIGRPEARFHREGLSTAQLPYLADHLACYTAFDIIVMGNIDPESIGAAHRELLRQYVTMGGTLAVNLGQNADRYKGTWVEEMLGVTISANRFEAEPALAQRALPDSPENGVTGNREGMVTTITPAMESMRALGAAYQLGSVRQLGSGRVATFTVDAVSGLMQHHESYLGFWNQLLLQSIVDRPLNMNAIVEAASLNLPRIAGVRLFPVSSVIIYLLLYFFVAIVANWFFWNWMKRREMAWVCLVFFSIAFTGYAMIFGTQGRARSTQLEQLEVLEMAGGNETAVLHSVTGLLAKGSGRFKATLPHSGTLVSDATSDQAIGVNRPGGLFGPQSQNAFHFIQQEQGAIDGLSVGASEMRFIRTETALPLEGALVTDLTASRTGLDGAIRNETGLPLYNPTLLFEGQTLRLEEEGGQYRISLPRQDLSATMNAPRIDANGAMTIADGAERETSGSFNSFLSNLPGLALNSPDRAIPPCLVAWVDQPPVGSLDMGERASLQLGATLAVAWLPVNDTRAFDSEPIELPLRFVNPDYSQNMVYQNMSGRRITGVLHGGSQRPSFPRNAALASDGSNWNAAAVAVLSDERMELAATLPEWVRGRPGYRVEIRVVTEANRYAEPHQSGNCNQGESERRSDGFQLTLSRRQGGKDVALPVTGKNEKEVDFKGFDDITDTVYQLDNWPDLLPPRSSVLRFEALAQSEQGKSLEDTNFGGRRGMRGNPAHYHAYITAHLVKIDPDNAGE